MFDLKTPIEWLLYVLVSCTARIILWFALIILMLVALVSINAENETEAPMDTITISHTQNCRVIGQSNDTATFECDIIKE
jgi:hypothetical protein